MKKVAVLALAALLCMAITGCASPGTDAKDASNANTEETAQTSAPAADAIKIEDIAWSIGQGNYGGIRAVTFDYTNNSPYVIFGMNLELDVRDDVAEEELTAFDEAYADNPYWTEWYGDPSEATIETSTERLANPGESVGSVPCFLNGASWTDTTIEQYELMEPSIMSIAYVYEGKVYLEYYDFLTQRYSLDSQSGKNAVEWSDSQLASTVPEVDAPVVSVAYDEDDYFSVRAWGVTWDMYESYIALCEDNGFTRDESRGGDRYYYAFDSEGCEIEIDYYDEDAKMSVALDADPS